MQSWNQTTYKNKEEKKKVQKTYALQTWFCEMAAIMASFSL